MCNQCGAHTSSAGSRLPVPSLKKKALTCYGPSVWEVPPGADLPIALLTLHWDAVAQAQIGQWYLSLLWLLALGSRFILMSATANPSTALNTEHPRAAEEKSPEITLSTKWL